MQADFWHQRWRDGRLGFHQQNINSRLKKLWRVFAPRIGETVLVPLCGKSLDMLWLGECGHRVLGVEISEIACRDFYRENHLAVTRQSDAHWIKFHGECIDVWCGDFFNLRAAELRDVRLVYDRAALIALPTSMRARYAEHLSKVLAPDAQLLLIAMEYDENKMKGPPFCVTEDEVREIFNRWFAIDIIAQSSGPDIVGNLAERGLDTLDEKVYRLQRLAQ